MDTFAHTRRGQRVRGGSIDRPTDRPTHATHRAVNHGRELGKDGGAMLHALVSASPGSSSPAIMEPVPPLLLLLPAAGVLQRLVRPHEERAVCVLRVCACGWFSLHGEDGDGGRKRQTGQGRADETQQHAPQLVVLEGRGELHGPLLQAHALAPPAQGLLQPVMPQESLRFTTQTPPVWMCGDRSTLVREPRPNPPSRLLSSSGGSQWPTRCNAPAKAKAKANNAREARRRRPGGNP